MNERDTELIKSRKLDKDVLIRGLDEINMKIKHKQIEVELFTEAEPIMFADDKKIPILNDIRLLQITKELSIYNSTNELKRLLADKVNVEYEIENFDEIRSNELLQQENKDEE